MARLALAIWLIVSAGCSTPPKPEPVTDWAGMDTVTTVASKCRPVAVPPPGRPGVTEVDGEEVIYYPVAEGERLEARLTALNANTEIAAACAAALEAAETERRALIEAGRRTEQRANYLADELWRESGDHLAERREHLMDNWIHRLIFVIGIAVGI